MIYCAQIKIYSYKDNCSNSIYHPSFYFPRTNTKFKNSINFDSSCQCLLLIYYKISITWRTQSGYYWPKWLTIKLSIHYRNWICIWPAEKPIVYELPSAIEIIYWSSNSFIVFFLSFSKNLQKYGLYMTKNI